MIRKFTKGLIQKPDKDIADGLQQGSNLSFQKIGSIRSVPVNDVGISYGAPVHSMGSEGLLGPGPLIAGVDTSVYRAETLLKSGFSGNKWAFSALAGFIYLGNELDGLWSYAGGGTLYRAGSPVPTIGSFAAGAGGGTGFTGTYTIYVTFVNANGQEGNAGTAITTPALANQNISLTNIPVNANADYNIAQRRIYITGGTTPLYTSIVRAKTIAGNTTTTATIAVSDVDATVELATDNFLPQAGSFLFELYSTLFLGGIPGSENTLYFSKTGLGEQWPITQGINISRSGDPMQWGLMWNGSGWVFTRKKIFQVIGSPGSGVLATNFYPKETGSAYGTTTGRSVVSTPYGLFFEAEDGIRKFDGTNSEIFSNDVEDVFNARNVSDDGESATVGEFWNDKLLYSIAQGTSTVPNLTLIYDFRTGTWSTHDQGYRSLWTDRANNSLLCGTANGVERFQNGQGFAGWTAWTNDFPLESPDLVGTFRKLQVDMEGSCDLSVYLDDALAMSDALSATSRKLLVRRLPAQLAQRASVKLQATAKATQDKVYAISIGAAPEKGEV